MRKKSIIEIKKELIKRKDNLSKKITQTYERFWAVHACTEPDKVIVFFFLNPKHNDNFQLYFCKKEITNELLYIINEYGKETNKSVHFSSASFVKYSRKSEHAYSISSITIDLDFYNTKYKDYDISEIIWENDFQGIFEKYNLTLNYVIDSGNGAYLVFIFNTPIALKTETDIAIRYIDIYKELVEEFKSFGADPKATDLARVFKLESTTNYKTNKIVNIRYKNPQKNSFAKTLDAYYRLCYEKRKKTLHRITPCGEIAPYSVEHKSNRVNVYGNYNERRMNDLRNLIEIREGDIRFRNNYLFICMVQMCYMGYSYERILEQCSIFNRHFVDPYPEKEVVRIVEYAKGILEAKLLGKEKDVYHCYRTETIIALLEITEEEMGDLDVLISKKIKKIRQNKIKAKKRLDKTKIKRDHDNWKKKQIYSKRCSVAEIREECNVSTATVYRTIKKLDLNSPKKEEMKKENERIIHMKKIGIKNKDICVELQMNANTLKKRIKDLKKQGRL